MSDRRGGPDSPRPDGPDGAWARALSSAAHLRPVDAAAVPAALEAVRAERRRAASAQRRRWGAALAAALLSGLLVTHPAAPADQAQAYAAYAEAARGW